MTAGRPKLKVKEKKIPIPTRFAPLEVKAIKKASKILKIKYTTFIRFASLSIATEVISRGLNADDLTY